jgi:hypothetical protein
MRVPPVLLAARAIPKSATSGAVVEQDVLRLDVAVNDPLPVGVVERPRHLPGDPHGVLHRQVLLAGKPVAERFAIDERHHIEDRRLDPARVMERQDVRMLQVGRGADLGQEPLGAEDGGQLGAEDLERHLAVVPEVVGQVDRGHAALAERALDRVAVGEGFLEVRERVGHWSLPRMGEF